MSGRKQVGYWALGIFVAVAAGGPDAGAAAPGVQGTVGLVSGILSLCGFAGVEQGIFLKHGLELKVKLLSSGIDATKALQAGEVHFTAAAVSHFPVAIERGLDAVAVVGMVGSAADPFDDRALAVIARAGSGVGGLGDLVGRPVGTLLGGSGDEYLRLLLDREGIRGEIRLLNVPPANQVNALHMARVDAVATWEPFAAMLLEKVPGAYEVRRGGGILGFHNLIHAMRRTLREQPEMVQQFVTGYAEACLFVRRHPHETAETASRWVPGLDAAVALKALKNLTYDPRISPMTLASFAHSMRTLVAHRKMKGPVPTERAFDSTFIERTMREYPSLFADLQPIFQRGPRAE